MSAGARCPACGGATREWRTVPGGEPRDPHRYALRRCESCATALTEDPAPADAYEAGVYAPSPPRALPLVRMLQRLTVGQPARALERAGLPPGARVLDVGAGAGRLVEELGRRGYAASGIEPSARSAGLAAKAGRAVKRRAIEEHEESDLGAVILWHVLEHLGDPLAALLRARNWLEPDGLVLIGVPNIASLQARIAGDAWLHLDVPRHRVHFTARGLHALLARAGLDPVRARHMVWEHNPGAMWMALLSRCGMTPGAPFHILKRTVRPNPRDLAMIAAGLPLAPLATAAEATAAAARRGGTVLVLARSRR